MTLNSKVVLTGNMGNEASIYQDKNKKLFASFSLATRESYQDKDENWQELPAVWHNSILVFQPKLVSLAKSFRKGARLQVTGRLEYEDFKVKEKGKTITKHEARIIALSIEPKPLPAKAPQEPSPTS